MTRLLGIEGFFRRSVLLPGQIECQGFDRANDNMLWLPPTRLVPAPEILLPSALHVVGSVESLSCRNSLDFSGLKSIKALLRFHCPQFVDPLAGRSIETRQEAVCQFRSLSGRKGWSFFENVCAFRRLGRGSFHSGNCSTTPCVQIGWLICNAISANDPAMMITAKTARVFQRVSSARVLGSPSGTR